MKIMSIEKIELIENMLKIGNYNRMYRININGFRIYVQENPFSYYSGLTGALSLSTFKGNKDSKRLTKWRNMMIDSFGEKNTDDFVDLTADFGTLSHRSLVTIKEKGCIKWNEEYDNACGYFAECFKEKYMNPDAKIIKSMAYEYQKHVSSIMQFIYERVQEIYAIETPAKNDDLRIATPIDLFCLCKQTEKGEYEKTVLNIKTSSQITQHHLEQAACELSMWNSTYGDKALNCAILRTKDWNEAKTPTYDYKYLPESDAVKLSDYAFQRMNLCLNSEDSYLPSPIIKKFTGETKVGEKPEIVIRNIKEEWELSKEVESIDVIEPKEIKKDHDTLF